VTQSCPSEEKIKEKSKRNPSLGTPSSSQLHQFCNLSCFRGLNLLVPHRDARAVAPSARCIGLWLLNKPSQSPSSSYSMTSAVFVASTFSQSLIFYTSQWSTVTGSRSPGERERVVYPLGDPLSAEGQGPQNDPKRG